MYRYAYYQKIPRFQLFIGNIGPFELVMFLVNKDKGTDVHIWSNFFCNICPLSNNFVYVMHTLPSLSGINVK